MSFVVIIYYCDCYVASLNGVLRRRRLHREVSTGNQWPVEKLKKIENNKNEFDGYRHIQYGSLHISCSVHSKSVGVQFLFVYRLCRRCIELFSFSVFDLLLANGHSKIYEFVSCVVPRRTYERLSIYRLHFDYTRFVCIN